jgi:ABC-type dipeptide/oligopeptide/nickel transport system permease component
MLSYLIRRWLLLVPTLALASVLIFGIITLAPGDPVRMKIGFEATSQEVAAERERLGLDKPLPVRYAVWVADVAQLNLGRSLVNSRPVIGLIADAFPNTLRLATVLGRHALRNALIPVVTVLGIQFGRLLGGAVVTEAVFAYPGLGRLVVTSIGNRDYPVVQGALMLVVVIFLLTSILVDLSYAFLDPRVTLRRGAG